MYSKELYFWKGGWSCKATESNREKVWQLRDSSDIEEDGKQFAKDLMNAFSYAFL